MLPPLTLASTSVAVAALKVVTVDLVQVLLPLTTAPWEKPAAVRSASVALALSTAPLPLTLKLVSFNVEESIFFRSIVMVSPSFAPT